MTEILIFSDINNAYGFSRYAGPYRIATELRQRGYSVQVVEFFAELSLAQIREILRKYISDRTLWVGFAATLWTLAQSTDEMLDHLQGSKSLRSLMAEKHVKLFPHSEEFMHEVFAEIRSLGKSCKIVVGGYKARHLQFHGVDFWILGQGESSAVRLSDHLKFGKSLDGIETECGHILSERLFPFQGFPTSQIRWLPEDCIRKGESLPIEIARGCVFRCAFCAFDLNGKSRGEFVKRIPALKEELLYNYDKFGTTCYMLTDDTLNDSPEKIESLHRLFTDLPFKLEFSAYCRIDVLHRHPSMLEALSEMGLRSVEFGIESLNAATCRAIGKGLPPDIVKETLETAKRKWRDRVYIAAGFIVGLPFETKESVRQTIAWLESRSCPLDGIQLNRLWINSPSPIASHHPSLGAAGFSKVSDGWAYGNHSGIALDPGKFGYEIESGGNWRNLDLTLEDAIQIERDFYSSSLAKAKFSLSIFQYYNRMRNLGFSHEDIGALYFNDPILGRNALSRKEAIKAEYLAQILA